MEDSSFKYSNSIRLEDYIKLIDASKKVITLGSSRKCELYDKNDKFLQKLYVSKNYNPESELWVSDIFDKDSGRSFKLLHLGIDLTKMTKIKTI